MRFAILGANSPCVVREGTFAVEKCLDAEDIDSMV